MHYTEESNALQRRNEIHRSGPFELTSNLIHKRIRIQRPPFDSLFSCAHIFKTETKHDFNSIIPHHGHSSAYFLSLSWGKLVNETLQHPPLYTTWGAPAPVFDHHNLICTCNALSLFVVVNTTTGMSSVLKFIFVLLLKLYHPWWRLVSKVLPLLIRCFLWHPPVRL